MVRDEGRRARSAVAAVLSAAALVAPAFACRPPLAPAGDGLLLEARWGLFGWAAVVADPPSMLKAEPGGTWAAAIDLEIDLGQYVPEMGRFRGLVVAVYGELRYDATGTYRSGATDRALSTVFTTSGEPVARVDPWPSLRRISGKNGSPFEGLVRFDLPAPDDLARMHRFSGRIDVEVPADIEPGWWHPRLVVMVEVEGTAEPLPVGMFYDELRAKDDPGFPLVEIGHPAVPKIPWTAFSNLEVWGRAGALPDELRGRVGLISRTTFPTELIVPPGVHALWPGLPSLFPGSALPVVTDRYDAPSPLFDARWSAARMEVSATVDGPDGFRDLGRRVADQPGHEGPQPTEGPFQVDMRRGGTYRIRMTGWTEDAFGRRQEGGGTWVVNVAMPLTFSTSCKPGTSFLVGNAFPPKVNVLPPVPASVEVEVAYYPQSDPARKVVWRAEGTANRFGHFTTRQRPLVFQESGEYSSLVKATYRDARGMLWMGQQASRGVIAPQEPDITLHGSLTLLNDARNAASGPLGRGRYAERLHYPDSVLLQATHVVRVTPGASAPHDPHDSLVVDLTLLDGIEIEPAFSIDVPDARLASRILSAGSLASGVLPRFDQTVGEPWKYIEDVFLRGKTNHAWSWSHAEPGRREELPVTSAARGPYHPFSFPGDLAVEAYVVFGIVRPGFMALVGAQQVDGIGTFFGLNPAAFGHNINATLNGDLPGDVYRVQAGVVVKDREAGVNHYDLYSSVVAIAEGTRSRSSVLPAGGRPLVSVGGVDHHLFLAIDTHDAVEVGEDLALGGMVFPNVPADVTWTVRSPSGRVSVVSGTADRRGIVRGSTRMAVDEPGAWDIGARVRHAGIEGGIVGTRNGDYWVCASPGDVPEPLLTDLPPATRIAPDTETRIPLRWSGDLKDVSLRFAALMPGRVLEQGTVRPDGPGWSYVFSPAEWAVANTNFDYRDYVTGGTLLGDTVVFQFCMDARDPDGRDVHGTLRLFLRGDTLMNLTGL
jgi:hypothetical protein